MKALHSIPPFQEKTLRFPQGLGLRQSSAAIERAGALPKAAEDCRSPGRCRARCVRLVFAALLVLSWQFPVVRAVAQTTNAGCVTAPSGLIGWWRGETNALDSAGTNNGALVIGVGFGFGEIGKAFVFDGVDGFVNVPSAPNFGTKDFTVEFWVKFYQLGGEQVMVEKYIETFDTNRSGWTITKLADNTLRFAQGGATTEMDFAIMSDNAWTHIAVARKNGYVTAFVNGTFRAAGSLPANLDTTASLKFGHRGNPADTPGSTDTRGFYLYGALDEVSLYERALTTNEIQAIYNAGSAGKCAATNPPASPPVITGQPVDTTASVGYAASFYATASGSAPLSFQWLFNGMPLVGWTNELLSLSNVQLTNAGGYSMIASNAYGIVTSAVARLTVVVQPPVITTQPKSQTNYVGSNVTFSIAAIGSPPFSHQWYYQSPVAQPPTPLAGRTNNPLILTNVQFGNAGGYFVVVTNAGGSVTSSPALLTVLPIPPCANVFSNLVSWWRAENNAKDNWDSNDGTESAKFAAGKVGMAFTSPQIRVTNSPSLQITNALTIEAWINPSTVAGSAPYTILSKFDYWTRLPGASQSSYYLGLTNNGRLFCMLSASGSATTNTTLTTSNAVPVNQWTHVAAAYDGTHIRLYINGAFIIAKDHFGGIFPGLNHVGIGALPYEQTSSVNAFNGLLDEVSLYNRALSADEIRAIYNADVTGKCLQPPIIVTQPQNQSIPLGEDVRFTVSALGSRPFAYQWFFGQSPITGATNSSLLLERVKTNQAGYYQVRVTNTLGLAWSVGPQLTLLPAPSCTPTPDGLISWWPGDGNGNDAMGLNPLYAPLSSPQANFPFVTGKVDRAFSFNGLSYRAYFTNSPSLNFGSNADFSIEAWIKAPFTNTTYPNVPLIEKRQLTDYFNGLGYSLSLNQGRLAFALGTLNTNQTATVSTFISPGPDLRDSMYHHVAITLNRRATNGGNLYVDGQPVLTFDPTPRSGSLSNSSSLYFGGPTTTVSNSYFFGQIDEPAIYNRALSTAEILALRNAGASGKCKVPPSLVVQPISQRVTIGSNVTFNVSATGSPKLTYQWVSTPQFLIPGATNSSYTFAVQSSGTNYVRVSNLFGTALSSNAVLTANHIPVARGPTTQVVELDEDTSATFELLASDADNDPLTDIIVTPPAHGTLSGTLPNLTYTPAPDFNGQDRFTYKVNDGLADSALATVPIIVNPVNDPPIAFNQALTVDEDTLTTVLLAANDVDGDQLTFSIVTPPAHGTFDAAGYLAATNYFGPDSFTFQVSDGKTNSNIATVSITVRPVNDAPSAKISVSPLAEFPNVTNQIVIAPVIGDAPAVLDGSASFDVENDPLQYFWSEGTNTFATGLICTNDFPPATHVVTLTVSDGQATGSATTEFEVLTPAQAVGLVMAAVDDAKAGRNTTPLLASLNAAARAFDRGNSTAALNELRAFQNKVRAQIAPADAELAARLIKGAQEIVNALNPGGETSRGGAALAPNSDAFNATNGRRVLQP